MNLKEITRVLQETFNKELIDGKKRHVVFWYDEEGEFLEEIDELHFDDVRIWKLTANNLFATKYELEKVDLDSHFIIYANMAKPSPREDWLLDVYKYSYEFATDKITVIMRDLGVTNDSLRPVFKKYNKFFNNKERYSLFQSYNVEEYTEETVDTAVLSALCRCSINSLDEVVKALFREQLDEKKSFRERIEKFGDKKAFWNLVEKVYGYSLQDKSIESLFIFFILTTASDTLTVPIPATWTKYISNRPTNCIVFMNQFMNHNKDRDSYNQLADKVEKLVRANDYIMEWEIKNYINSDTFRSFDEKIIEYIMDQLINDVHQYNNYIELVNIRRTKHWYSVFENEYKALTAAIELFQKSYELDYFIREQSCYEMFQAYTSEFYNLDTAYRKFYAAFDQLENKEQLMAVRDKVENLYCNWYLDELSIKWSQSIEKDQDNHWPINGLVHQHEFYRSYIQPYVNREERVFVIISDALRYEAAKELTDLLNNERKGSTEITAMQGIVPSYTDLGMASLLPYKEISVSKTEGRHSAVYVDGYKASNTENRNQVLVNHSQDSLAIQHEEISGMNRQDMRNALSGKKVIYIYHNAIDARGDHAATEREVFSAVENTFKEVRSLVNNLINSVSAANIYITADHGFIYNRDSLQASDKVIKNVNDSDIEKRRFIISNQVNSIEGTMNFSLDYLLSDECGKYVTVPRGSNRFAVQGAGANYVHGGAMLQEIVVPVIKFKSDRSKSSKNDIKKVQVKPTSVSRKVTNTITYLEFFQTERVESKKKPLRLKLYFIDESGNRISNENIIIADSTSQKPENRTYKEKFVFKTMTYSKTAKYFLVLEDEEESVENIYDKIPFTIDIAFSNDFGF